MPAPAPQPRRSTRRARAFVACVLLFCCGALAPAHAQTDSAAQPASPPPALGTITGRVVADDGQPLAGAQIIARNVRNKYSGAQSDADGKFTLKNLERGAYTISAYLPGYYDAATVAQERGTRAYYRAGDSVTIRLSKGGVITGRVRDGAGEPLVAVRVSVVRLRDEQGRPATQSVFIFGTPVRQTDDRGVYRHYGLPPGTYLVAAGGRGRFGLNERPSTYDDDAPTFYPSTTRDGAAEVVVQGGQEQTDVDIRYRGEPGHAVSGAVEGPGGPSDARISVTLAPTGSIYLASYRYLSAGTSTFVFESVADGDYDLVAEQLDNDRERNAAASMRVSVRGADVTGLKLTLAPLASITGRVVLEAAPPAAPWRAQCPDKFVAVAGDTTLIVRRDSEARADRSPPGGAKLAETAPDDKGAFALHGLAPGRFRLDVRPPAAVWYVRDATLAALPANAASGANSPARSAALDKNPLADGLTLAAGTQITGLSLTLAPGAAELRGRVAVAGALPADLLVYLVPAERERADDALRYRGARVGDDGAFAFTHVAPGRYQLVARPAPTRTQSADEAVNTFLFPDAPTRTQLRRDAATAEAFELQPCQRSADHVLRYAPR